MRMNAPRAKSDLSLNSPDLQKNHLSMEGYFSLKACVLQALSRTRHRIGIFTSSSSCLQNVRCGTVVGTFTRCYGSVLSQKSKRFQRLSFISTRALSINVDSDDKWTRRLSKRDIADLEDWLSLHVPRAVSDPILGIDLASLKWMNPRIAISADGTIQVLLRLPSLLHPKSEVLKSLVKDVTKEQVEGWLNSASRNKNHGNTPVKVNVEMIAVKPVSGMSRLVEDQEALLTQLGPGLESVAHFIAVYSCKGGVGKSSVSVNLAYELARMGGRIGLLDLDIYGPSLPILVKPDDVAVRQSSKGPGMVHPIEHGSVKMISLGFVSKQSGVPGSGEGNGASVMRGPMAGKVVTQLLKGTDWGELDVLVCDLPPGTGDVQLAVLQELQLSGAVAVTTPSKLATADTLKGIEMFTSMGVPTLAVVENMSYFEVDGIRHFPFGEGMKRTTTFSALHGSPKVVEFPLSKVTHSSNEDGEPLCLSRPKGAERELEAFHELANIVSGSLLRYHYGSSDDPETVSFPGEKETFLLSTTALLIGSKTEGESMFTVRMFSENGAVQKRINPAQLRVRDPRTGDIIKESPFLAEAKETGEEIPKSSFDGMVQHTSSKQKVAPSLVPLRVAKRGRYGFSVDWADGATIIYANSSIVTAAGGTIMHR